MGCVCWGVCVCVFICDPEFFGPVTSFISTLVFFTFTFALARELKLELDLDLCLPTLFFSCR